MSIKKKIAVAIATISALAVFTACGKEEDKTLVMATNAQFPPYEYHENDDIVGIDVEIAKAIAEDMGYELKIEDMAFESILAAVQSGKADMGVAGLTVSEDRLVSVDFSIPYTTSSQVIIVKETSEIASPDNLEGKKIGVQIGTTGAIYAEDIADATIEQYNSGIEAVQALNQDKIDAVIIDKQPAKAFVEKAEGLKILDEDFTTEDYAIAVKKGNTELKDKIDASLNKLKDSGKLQEIIDKYIPAE